MTRYPGKPGIYGNSSHARVKKRVTGNTPVTRVTEPGDVLNPTHRPNGNAALAALPVDGDACSGNPARKATLDENLLDARFARGAEVPSFAPTTSG